MPTEDFVLPQEALGSHIAIVGKTGSGKSATSRTIVEHVARQGFRVCILDTIKSDWWGITSSADGKSAGLPFTILGGPRAHVPIHSGAGTAIGELVATGKLPLSIIDMRQFEPGGIQRFFIDFAAALMEHSRGVLYLVIEEAHEVAPKEKAGVGGENMATYWAKKLATAGRSLGLRLIVATQRTQALHNAVLGSCDTLVAHRLVAPADKTPIVAWFKDNLEDTKAVKEIAASIPNLPTGCAWVYSGEAGFLEQVTFPLFSTFDNTKTPLSDAHSIDVATAPVDVGALHQIIGSAIEEAEANDPKVLKARIKELEGRKESTANADIMRSRIEEATAPLIQRIDTLETFIAEGAKEAENLSILASNHRARFTFGDALIEESYKAEKAETVKSGDIYTTETAKVASAVASQPTIAPTPVERPVSDRTQTKHQRMIRTLAEMRSVGALKVDRKVLAGLTGQSHKSSAYDQALRELRGQGLIESGPAGLSLTKDGIASAGKVGKPPSLAELHKTWRSFLSRSAVRCLEVVIRLHPKSVERLDIAKIAGISPTSSSFDAALRELRGWGLIAGSKVVEGTALLFPEGLK